MGSHIKVKLHVYIESEPTSLLFVGLVNKQNGIQVMMDICMFMCDWFEYGMVH